MDIVKLLKDAMDDFIKDLAIEYALLHSDDFCKFAEKENR